mgnify:CR=1 FL=1
MIFRCVPVSSKKTPLKSPQGDNQDQKQVEIGQLFVIGTIPCNQLFFMCKLKTSLYETNNKTSYYDNSNWIYKL